MSERDENASKENGLRRAGAGVPEATIPISQTSRREASIPAKVVEIVGDELEPDGDDWPVLVPPGEYELAFVSDEKFYNPIFGRWIWNISMKIMDAGEHCGKIIPFYLDAIPMGKRPTSGWYISSAFLIATERRPPKDLCRRRPRSFMDGCVFRAQVKTSMRDSHGVKLPEAGHKSKVKCLVERIAGTPPCLTGK